MNRQLTHEEYQKQNKPCSCVFVLDHMEDPYNISSTFRLADAFGMKHVYLTGSSNVLEREKVIRVSRHTLHYVPHSYEEDAVALITRLKKEGYQIIALELTNQSISLYETTFHSDKIAFVVGNEKHGILPEILQVVDQTIHIDMYGMNSSMNVVMCLGLASYQYRKDRR